ncbi:MAG: ABC transporter ATP-binding protein [Chloroflexota bacterium]|nr:ABC transporter ATP-binding protein [Chloroflexota bacterium]
MATEIKKQDRKVVNAIEEDLEQLSSYDGAVAARFIKYIKPYKREALIGVISVILFTIAVLSVPLMVKFTIDNAITDNNGGLLNILFIGLIGFSIMHFASNYVQQRVIREIGEKILFDIRSQMFTHLQRLSMSVADRSKYGSIMSRVLGDVGALQELFQAGVFAIGDLLTLLIITIIIFSLNWSMALGILLIMPVFLGLRIFWLPKARKAFLKARASSSVVSGVLNEHVNGIRVTQNMIREDVNQDRFDERVRENFDDMNDAAKYGSGIHPPVELLVGLTMSLIVVLGGYLVSGGSLEIGVMIAFLLYVQRFFDPIRALTMHYSVLQRAMASGHRIFELLDINIDIKDSKGAEDRIVKKGSIKFKDVNFEYNYNEPVLKNINLEINEKETVGLVGPTGSGKTTIASLIHRFYEIKNGNILIDDQDLQKVTQSSLSENISMVLQDPIIFSGTVEDNIKYKAQATREEVIEASKLVGSHDFIMTLPKGYDTNLEESGANLSIGQRQLLSFARALLLDSKIFILDEATSYIDSYTERQIQKALDEVLKNRTGIIIAHRLSTIKNADKIVVLDKGEIQEIGSHHELLNNKGLYWKLWNNNESSFDDLN